ncbi:hypothetical protein KY084_00870 [Stakelama sp. CBK3Z-3]|uniref:DUF1579 domain-containing protein n=1 Tax=Stakelama flava TaxID=2860338 RepID=A0ABS6XIZ0_9SPHN|nr:hypothetical protein [Stakelama flava]MBW4329430.1 hypothetical protein [Stakelama flava]
MTDERDLTGIWYGSYSGAAQRNAFIADLTELSGSVTGSITEPDDFHFGDLRRAIVSGARGGPTVAFVKQYDGAGLFAHAVDYIGQVNADGTEVTGTWSVDSTCRGRFSMRREKFAADELADADAEALETRQ